MPFSKNEFSALVASHSKWLTGFLRGLTRNEADAEDAFQEVWARVFSRALPDNLRSERAFLAQVARSVVIDRHRRSERFVVSADKTTVDGDSLMEGLVDPAPTPCEIAERDSLHEAVLVAIRSLRHGPREVVLLRIEAELTFQEISDLLGIPLGTVLGWMKSATNELKRKLKGCYERRS